MAAPSDPALPRVITIVLSWNGRADTLACLASLRDLRYPAHEVLVVDNASTDGSPEAIRRAHPEVSLIENPENLGYAGGNNVGIAMARSREADFVWLLNNDTRVAPDAV